MPLPVPLTRVHLAYGVAGLYLPTRFAFPLPDTDTKPKSDHNSVHFTATRRRRYDSNTSPEIQLGLRP